MTKTQKISWIIAAVIGVLILAGQLGGGGGGEDPGDYLTCPQLNARPGTDVENAKCVDPGSGDVVNFSDYYGGH